MKTILLLRHAKADKKLAVKDFERSLTKHGHKDALRMGHFVKEIGSLPDVIISSPAKRAKQTCNLFVEAAAIDTALITWDDELYYGGARNYLSIIQHVSEDISNLMLVGHNPLMEETVSLLCNDEGRYGVHIPTAGLVCIEYPANTWGAVKSGAGHIQWMMTPKLIKNREE